MISRNIKQFFAGWVLVLILFGQSAVGSDLKSLTNLPNFDQPTIEKRGKILIVVTSTNEYSTTGKKTGYNLTELSRAYYTFRINGFEVDITSPKGGPAPDDGEKEDLEAADHMFLTDRVAQFKINNTLPVKDVVAEEYVAIYFVGGKGTMFDFPDNQQLKEITRKIYEKGGIVSAVCHGPAGLLNVKLSNGKYLVDGRQVNSMSNDEDLWMDSDAEKTLTFLLEDKLGEQGAVFKKANALFIPFVVEDDRLITGANPWSTWLVAEAVINKLGYTLVKRTPSDYERTVEVAKTYFEKGYDEAERLLATIENPVFYVAFMHSFIRLTQGDLSNALKIIWLAI